MTSYALIDYGFGRARFWGEFDPDSVERVFMNHANECFGIRKSISDFKLLEYKASEDLPSPWNKFEGATTMLKHSGDTIVWNADCEKIKSEWD
jgi:hypothetical protein